VQLKEDEKRGKVVEKDAKQKEKRRNEEEKRRGKQKKDLEIKEDANDKYKL
jgi:hypothetical protein|tara:strand:+ start:422 stop:574 length:153 start_codon:yes stop_codon:yes gene_type:complete